MKDLLYLPLFALILSCASQPDLNLHQINEGTDAQFVTCLNNPHKQTLRSNELQEIVKQDQSDRNISGPTMNWNRISAADQARVKRVAEIFAEGCIKSARDYSAAALIFQHGVVSDHYYQAYLWSKRALELGDQTQKLMIANTIDRYLLSLGYKQLFGAQSLTSSSSNGCYCLEPTEVTFPDQLRLKISGIRLIDRINSLKRTNQKNSFCEKTLYCDKSRPTPPKGLFPGIW